MHKKKWSCAADMHIQELQKTKNKIPKIIHDTIIAIVKTEQTYSSLDVNTRRKKP